MSSVTARVRGVNVHEVYDRYCHNRYNVTDPTTQLVLGTHLWSTAAIISMPPMRVAILVYASAAIKGERILRVHFGGYPNAIVFVINDTICVWGPGPPRSPPLPHKHRVFPVFFFKVTGPSPYGADWKTGKRPTGPPRPSRVDGRHVLSVPHRLCQRRGAGPSAALSPTAGRDFVLFINFCLFVAGDSGAVCFASTWKRCTRPRTTRRAAHGCVLGRP